ncbi:hypothetical protein [Bacillus cereus]|uniref:hypothetical protein n=1 Tax=Bacillus cereus TaxID=1396 RepID=UPI000BFD3C0A|nr:hypothetical protein [Bacillus cereus]PGR83692.1 hypothetical protein COC63_06810 [Bacillus cereus]
MTGITRQEAVAYMSEAVVLEGKHIRRNAGYWDGIFLENLPKTYIKEGAKVSLRFTLIGVSCVVRNSFVEVARYINTVDGEQKISQVFQERELFARADKQEEQTALLNEETKNGWYVTGTIRSVDGDKDGIQSVTVALDCGAGNVVTVSIERIVGYCHGGSYVLSRDLLWKSGSELKDRLMSLDAERLDHVTRPNQLHIQGIGKAIGRNRIVDGLVLEDFPTKWLESNGVIVGVQVTVHIVTKEQLSDEVYYVSGIISVGGMSIPVKLCVNQYDYGIAEGTTTFKFPYECLVKGEEENGEVLLEDTFGNQFTVSRGQVVRMWLRTRDIPYAQAVFASNYEDSLFLEDERNRIFRDPFGVRHVYVE